MKHREAVKRLVQVMHLPIEVVLVKCKENKKVKWISQGNEEADTATKKAGSYMMLLKKDENGEEKVTTTSKLLLHRTTGKGEKEMTQQRLGSWKCRKKVYQKSNHKNHQSRRAVDVN